MEKADKIIKAWEESVKLMPILQVITFEQAVRRLKVFKDDPRGELENSIDSAFVEYETTELEFAVYQSTPQPEYRIDLEKWPEAFNYANTAVPAAQIEAMHPIELKDRGTRNYYKAQFPALLDGVYQEMLDKSEMIHLTGGHPDEMVEFMEEDLNGDLITLIYRVGRALGLLIKINK